jgi:hypothetical protein
MGMDELEISGKRFISTRLAAKLHKYHSDYIGQLIRGKKIAGQKVGRSWYVDAESLEAYFATPRVAEAPKQILSVEPVRHAPKDVEETAIEPEPAPEESVAQEEETPVAEVVEETVAEDPEPAAAVLPSFRRPLRVSDTWEVVSPAAEESAAEKVVEQKEEVVVAEAEGEPVRDTIHIPIRKTESKKSTGLRYLEDDAPALPEIEEMPAKKSNVRTMRKEMEEVREELLADASARGSSFAATAVVPVVSVLALGALVFAAVALSSVFVNSTTTIEAGKAASAGYSLH